MVSGDNTQFTIPEEVTEIGKSAFNNCTNLMQINIPEGVTTIGEKAFQGTNLTQINIPESVTEIGDGAFSHCWQLAQINIPQNVTEIGFYTFFGCRSLTEITIPEGVTEIVERAFLDCINLTQITIPESVTVIGDQAFCGCIRLNKITIPESVTEIEAMVFYCCDQLTQITIPESVIKIGRYAFRRCPLTQINIPKCVTEIDESAFIDCNQLRYIVVDSDSEIGRVKNLLPQVLRTKITSFYCKHIANIDTIRRAQFYILSSSISLFNNCFNDSISTGFIAHKVYQFLSLNELKLLAITHRSLKPICALYNTINEVTFDYDIPTTSRGNTITKEFLTGPIHSKDEKSTNASPYANNLNRFKMDIRHHLKLHASGKTTHEDQKTGETKLSR